MPAVARELNGEIEWSVEQEKFLHEWSVSEAHHFALVGVEDETRMFSIYFYEMLFLGLTVYLD